MKNLHITAQTKNGHRVDLFYKSLKEAQYKNRFANLSNYQIIGLESE